MRGFTEQFFRVLANHNCGHSRVMLECTINAYLILTVNYKFKSVELNYLAVTCVVEGLSPIYAVWD